MAAAVSYSVSAQGKPGATPRRRTARSFAGRRRPASWKRTAIKLLFSIVLVAVVFGYVDLYANLTTRSYNRADLLSQCRMEKIKNQRLKVELLRITSPQQVLADAEKAHMVPATQYDYLNRPETVASAGRQAE